MSWGPPPKLHRWAQFLVYVAFLNGARSSASWHVIDQLKRHQLVSYPAMAPAMKLIKDLSVDMLPE